MGSRERRERARAEVRRAILDAAGQIFAEEGYGRLTLRRIAEEIEYSPTAIYLHFRDKNELLQAVCEETFSQLAGTLERLRESADTPLGFLRDGLRTHIDFGLSHRHQYIVAFMNPGQGPEGAPFGRAIGSRAFEVLRESVRACVESGDIRTESIDTTAQALWAAAHGLTSLLITMKEVPLAARRTLIEHTLDTLIAGLRAPAAAPARPSAPTVQSATQPGQPAEPTVQPPALSAEAAAPKGRPAARQASRAAPRARSYYLD